MNTEALHTELSLYGQVNFCDYNTDEKLNFIIDIENVNNDFDTEIGIKQSIKNHCDIEFSKFEHYSLNNGRLKIQLGK